MKRRNGILLAVALCCAGMILTETVLRPGYLIKSALKLVLFLGTVLIFRPRRLLNREGAWAGVWLGAGIYALLLAAFFLLRPFIDLEAIAAGLLGKEGVDRGNFLWVALYISLVNSLLEELLFRGLAFLELRRHTRFAGVFSAGAFAVYHIGILDGWFPPWIYGSCLAGLFAGGLVFNRLDRRGSILPSWLAHAAANLAINTIGLMMFGLLPGTPLY